ncbi:hypothetical protein J2W55_000747 [Mucilaginibacter pocheonensis]|uniref:Uncharacterized protein n=1 Tax=Mucilaginibacter pocheonensis TaxID=398050 RepID=A0ABU1T6D1_9SPHI|nr:hypothetical protein [Mucilaginibacter pocheonensis]
MFICEEILLALQSVVIMLGWFQNNIFIFNEKPKNNLSDTASHAIKLSDICRMQL